VTAALGKVKQAHGAEVVGERPDVARLYRIGMAALPFESAPIRPDHTEAHHTPHAILRAATRDWHDRVDDAFTRFDIGTHAGLGAFLQRQAAALLPLERQIERSGAAARLPDWDARRRSDALVADLEDLGVAVPVPTGSPKLPSWLHGFGALYVLEGSKIGGRVLLRQVKASPDPRVRATTRFLGHTHQGGWAGFLGILNALPPTAQAIADLEEGACMAFAAFLSAADAAGHDDARDDRCSGLVRSSQA
jgi:heme oxygenase (biliverdin-IX-beta and delta-forming)